MAKKRKGGLPRQWPEFGVEQSGGYPTRGTGIGTRGGRTRGEVLRPGQQSYIDQLRGTPKGKIEGKGRSIDSKRRLNVLENQKAVKRTPKKKNEMSIQEQGKLRKKKEQMEAEGRANIKKNKESKRLWGDWFNTSQDVVKKRIKSAKKKKQSKPSKNLYDDIWTD